MIYSTFNFFCLIINYYRLNYFGKNQLNIDEMTDILNSIPQNPTDPTQQAYVTKLQALLSAANSGS